MIAEINTRETVLTNWYTDYFPKACRYIQKNGGTLEDAKEIFQEAIVRLFEKKFLNSSDIENEEAYLMQVIKNVWISMVEKNQKVVSIDPIDVMANEDASPINEKVYRMLKASGKRCLDLLQSFYYEKLSMRLLAERFGYKSERSATVQKFKCIEKVRNEVKTKSLSYEDFFN